MRYFVEIWCERRDGADILTRSKASSKHEALEDARLMAKLMFPQHENHIGLITVWFEMACWFENDLGDKVQVRAAWYGEAAQVMEGVYFL